MPSSVGPNIKGEENLVFGYDLGDVSNSYKGEPTTNLLPNGIASGHNSGGYGNVVTVTDATAEKGVGWKKVTISNRGSNFRILQWTYLNMLANTTYCFSAEFDWGNMRDKGYYINHDGSGGGSRTFYLPGNYVTGQGDTLLITSLVPNGKIAGIISKTIDHTHSFFINNPTTGVSGLNDYFYYKDFQVEINTHPTQYTTGTRSVTQGLLDITRKSEVYLTNTLFDSNAQISFNGLGSNYIEIPDNPSLDISDNLTIEFWFKPYAYRSDLYTVNFIKKFTGTTDANFMFYFDGTYTPQKFRVLATRGGAWGSVSPDSSVIPLNTWTHVVWTYSNGGLLYINGVSQGTKTGSGVLSTNNTSIQIGSTLNGAVANYKMYKSALSAQEILDNYNAGKARFSV
jgi:hypothetical protein